MWNREITNHHIPSPILEARTHRLRRIYTLEAHTVSTPAQFPNHEFGILVRIFDHQNAEGGAHGSTCQLKPLRSKSTTTIQLANRANLNPAEAYNMVPGRDPQNG